MSTVCAQRPIRICWQSYVDEALGKPYLDNLRVHLDQVRKPGSEVTIWGLTPPDSFAHPLVEYRCAHAVIRNAIRAQREGYDVFAIGHIQDSGLWEARSAVDIPVVGLGEVSMLHACMLGGRAGIVTINPRFIPGFRQQIRKYGLESRIAFIDAVDHQPGEFMHAFEAPQARAAAIEKFSRQAERLVASGVEVFIPGGGIPMLLLELGQVREIAGAPVLNGLSVLIKYAETSVELRRSQGLNASRLGDFKLPPAPVIQEFLDS